MGQVPTSLGRGDFKLLSFSISRNAEKYAKATKNANTRTVTLDNKHTVYPKCWIRSRSHSNSKRRI